MPGKWGGAHWERPPRSPNELGCQANGGARAGRAPPDPPMDKSEFAVQELKQHNAAKRTFKRFRYINVQQYSTMHSL